MTDKLTDAQAALADGDTASACTILGDFVKQAQAQSGKRLTELQAAELVAAANQIRAVLVC